ncbi:hypothetical protein ACWGID_02215 [Kribbella sp. NPDC054772]
MFNTPLSQDLVKAESAYRLERNRRSWSVPRRERAERATQPESRHARRTLRPTTAA